MVLCLLDPLDSSHWIPLCSNLLAPNPLALCRLAHALLDCSSPSVLVHSWPVPIPDSSLMNSMVSRLPDHFLESILRLVFYR
jgi:hypothetical protein